MHSRNVRLHAASHFAADPCKTGDGQGSIAVACAEHVAHGALWQHANTVLKPHGEQAACMIPPQSREHGIELAVIIGGDQATPYPNIRFSQWTHLSRATALSSKHAIAETASTKQTAFDRKVMVSSPGETQRKGRGAQGTANAPIWTQCRRGT
jgi:hypothetical protein